MKTIRITLAQAIIRHLAALRIRDAQGQLVPYCAGAWAIFGHGNVAGIGEALAEQQATFPTFRAHNEQSMAHSAVAFAKAHFRRRVMAVTTSIGPGATNLVTAAGVAHVNRLPVLLLPGDVFASRAPDPVLQQLEDFVSADVSVNDCLRPVSRYFDRIMSPEQILSSLPQAIRTLLNPATCGPVTLALPQDVQTLAFDCPEDFLQEREVFIAQPAPDQRELQTAVQALRAAKKPLLIAGGGALYSDAAASLRKFCEHFHVPVAETQAGKSSMPWKSPLNLGAMGVTGSPAANACAREADLIIAVGCRLQDFITGSHALFAHTPILQINVQNFDAGKRGALPLVGDAAVCLQQLQAQLGSWQAEVSWVEQSQQRARDWQARIEALTTQEVPAGVLPYDAEVIGAVRASATAVGQHSDRVDIALCAGGTLPAELHKLWRTTQAGGYHMEYGYSCMGYEIAGGLGVKMARPEAEVIVMVGDGSYMMANSELATSVMLGQKIIVVVLDNRGFGCISRLQQATGQKPFNNMLDDCIPAQGQPSSIDFAGHARSMGAHAVHVKNVKELEAAMIQARGHSKSSVVVIDTTATRTTPDGGCWWEVAVPEVSQQQGVGVAFKAYQEAKTHQRHA